MLVERDGGSRIRVSSEHWSAVHDARWGGAWTELRLTHGSVENLLAGPCGAEIDDLCEVGERSAQLSVEEAASHTVVRATGHLADGTGVVGAVVNLSYPLSRRRGDP
jgi:hypothetical protein